MIKVELKYNSRDFGYFMRDCFTISFNKISLKLNNITIGENEKRKFKGKIMQMTKFFNLIKLWFKLNLNNIYHLQPADMKSSNFYFKIRYKIDCCMHMYIPIKIQRFMTKNLFYYVSVSSCWQIFLPFQLLIINYINNIIDRIIRINNYEPILLIRKRNEKPATFPFRKVETFSPFYHFQTLEVIDGNFDAASSKLLSVGASNEMPAFTSITRFRRNNGYVGTRMGWNQFRFESTYWTWSDGKPSRRIFRGKDSRRLAA